MSKQTLTYIVASIIAISGWWWSQPLLLSAGLFAFSGAVTNGLAIHMLFEKVPLIYGSGVIPTNFEKFKTAIRDLFMNEFFSQENIENWLQHKQQAATKRIALAPVIDTVDFNPAFDSLLVVIESSKFGSMLGMFGGAAMLEPLRESFIASIKDNMVAITEQDEVQSALQQQLIGGGSSEAIQQQVSPLIDQRLDELTPERVKIIVQNLIKQHLGWLVIWGGVFGGAFGVLAELVRFL